MKTIVAWLTLIFLSVAILFLARQIQQKNIALSNNRPSVAIAKTNPVILELISGDFKGILSDYLVLQTSQFIGEAGKYIPDEDLEALAHLLSEAQRLDPYFFTIPYYAEGSLARNPFIVKKINAILQTSHNYRIWDWESGFYLGFNYFYYLNQNKKAADILQKASRRPDAPMILGFLAAKFSQEAGSTEASIKLLQVMLQTTEVAEVKSEIQKRINGYKGVYVLEQALNQYHTQFHKYPADLLELVTSGLIKELPLNPYHDSFWYDSSTGKVSFFPFD